LELFIPSSENPADKQLTGGATKPSAKTVTRKKIEERLKNRLMKKNSSTTKQSINKTQKGGWFW
jgi:hypothetical protein